MYFDQLLDFKYYFYYSFTLYYCAIFYSLDAGFLNTICVSNSLDPDQARHFNSLKVISRQQKSSLAGKELHTKKLVDATVLLKLWLK